VPADYALAMTRTVSNCSSNSSPTDERRRVRRSADWYDDHPAEVSPQTVEMVSRSPAAISNARGSSSVASSWMTGCLGADVRRSARETGGMLEGQRMCGIFAAMTRRGLSSDRSDAALKLL